MPHRERHGNLLQRGLIGFWFCGIGALGFLRFFMRAFRDHRFEADPVEWLWLAGAVAMTIAGIAVVAHAARRDRTTTGRR